MKLQGRLRTGLPELPGPRKAGPSWMSSGRPVSVRRNCSAHSEMPGRRTLEWWPPRFRQFSESGFNNSSAGCPRY